MIINCKVCSFRNTEICPHLAEVGDAKGKKPMHSNKYCTFWFDFIRETYTQGMTKPKLLQVGEITKNKILTDKMFHQWTQTGKLSKYYDKVQKNLLRAVADMRKQDEGVKINQDIDITMEELRKVVDAQAKVVEGKDIIKDVEFSEVDTNGRNRQDMDGDRDSETRESDGQEGYKEGDN